MLFKLARNTAVKQALKCHSSNCHLPFFFYNQRNAERAELLDTFNLFENSSLQHNAFCCTF